MASEQSDAANDRFLTSRRVAIIGGIVSYGLAYATTAYVDSVTHWGGLVGALALWVVFFLVGTAFFIPVALHSLTLMWSQSSTVAQEVAVEMEERGHDRYTSAVMASLVLDEVDEMDGVECDHDN